MFSQYAMSPNGSSCPPMEPTYSNSSEYSMQSSNVGSFHLYGVDETDFELCPQPSHPSSASSVYASSYPSSSSFSSSYTSSPFEPSYDVSPPMMCPSDVPQSLQAPFFSPMQGSWTGPSTQAPSVDESLFAPDTQYMMMSDMSDMPDTAKPKPYVCPCSKAFTRPADLKRHESTVHNPVYKDCPVEECLRKASNGFPRQDHLIEHLRSYHHWDVPKRRVIKRVAKSS